MCCVAAVPIAAEGERRVLSYAGGVRRGRRARAARHGAPPAAALRRRAQAPARAARWGPRRHLDAPRLLSRAAGLPARRARSPRATARPRAHRLKPPPHHLPPPTPALTSDVAQIY